MPERLVKFFEDYIMDEHREPVLLNIYDMVMNQFTENVYLIEPHNNLVFCFVVLDQSIHFHDGSRRVSFGVGSVWN